MNVDVKYTVRMTSCYLISDMMSIRTKIIINTCKLFQYNFFITWNSGYKLFVLRQ